MTFTDTLRWLIHRIEGDNMPPPIHGTAGLSSGWNFTVATDAELTRWANYLGAEPAVVEMGRHGERHLSVSGAIDTVPVVVFSDEYMAAAEQVPA